MRKIHKIICHWSATPYTGSPVTVQEIEKWHRHSDWLYHNRII